MTQASRPQALPRAVHPVAWWLWAIGLAVAASRTTNPLLLCLVLGVVCLVVSCRRTDAPWARGFRYYLYLGGFIVLSRLVFRVVFGDGGGGHVLLDLPTIGLPSWAAGITLLGPVTAQSLLGGLYAGLALATIIVCLGAASSLANPRRLLKSLPGALYEVGTAVVVALSVAPQLVESVQRVRRARRLRAAPGSGVGALHGIVVPVLEDALDRSRALAAAMDSRGYGRSAGESRRTRAVTGTLVVGGLLGMCAGVYGLLDASTPQALGAPTLLVGAAVSLAGLRLGGRRVRRSRYRPDPWLGPEWLVTGSGLVAAVVCYLVSATDAAHLDPSLDPLTWPQLPLLPAAAVLVAALPAFFTPRPPTAVPDLAPQPLPVPDLVAR